VDPGGSRQGGRRKITVAGPPDGTLPDGDVSCPAGASAAEEQARAEDPVRQRALKELKPRLRR
jgi:hypothetical protein